MQTTLIAGTVGRDAKLRTTQSGDQVLGFSVAVDNGKDAQGNRRDATWWDCSIWGKRATALAPYITKGTKVTVTGRPSARVHNDKAYLQLSVDQLSMQGGGQDRQSPSAQHNPDPARQAPPAMDDEIPF